MSKIRKQSIRIDDKSELQTYLPSINQRNSGCRRLRTNEGTSQKMNFEFITQEMKDVEKSIKNTVRSLEKLEACLGYDIKNRKKKSRTKFLTQVSNVQKQMRDSTTQDFYQKIQIQRSYIRKISKGQQSIKSSMLQSKQSKKKITSELKQQQKKQNVLFQNIRTYLDRRLGQKNSQSIGNQEKLRSNNSGSQILDKIYKDREANAEDKNKKMGTRAKGYRTKQNKYRNSILT